MFVVCGEALWDLFAVEGEMGLSFDARIGGSPFNVAVGLSRMDQRSALLTGLSTDRLGERLSAALVREGVDTRFLVRSPRPTTLSVVDVGPDGGPAYAFYGENAADREVTPDALPEFASEVWGFHMGSYSLVVEPVGSSLLALATREAGQRLVTLDPNVRPTVEPDLGIWRTRLNALLAHVDVVKVSSEDLEILYPDASHAQIGQRWLAAGAALVIITRGEDGAEAFGSFGRLDVDGVRIEVADTVGAGDTFQAALIAGLAERAVRSRAALKALSVDECRDVMRFAMRAAAITCSRRGADLPRRSDVNLD